MSVSSSARRRRAVGVAGVLPILLITADASAQPPSKWIAVYEGTGRACSGYLTDL
jgi:hypothetical protein